MAPLLTTGAGKFPAIGGGGGGGVVFDAAGTKLYTASVTTANYTGITVGSGSNRALIMTMNSDGPANPASVNATWDSGGVVGSPQPMTLIKNEDLSGGQYGCYIFGLVAPSPGNLNLALSWTGSARVFISAIAFTGVDQTSAAVAFPHATSGVGVATVSVTSATGNMVVGCGQNTSTISGVTGTTIFSDSVSGSNISAFANYASGAASVTIGQVTLCTTLVATDVKAA